ncbi:tyrosine-type recombinase/integrase [Maribacter sp. 2-571]|uniref:tyrosine-type recombinase/integrase n=1 Tax=Maribacter sp. 2-571 TaxID=3417569 RepID=UPI003D33A3D1
MKTYKEYLQQHNYSPISIKGNLRLLKHFEKWCKRNGTTAETIDYKTCLKYVRHLTRKGNKKKTVNHKLRRIKTYLDYLIEEGNRSNNPLADIRVKGEKRSIHYDLLESEELEDLYYSFETTGKQEIYHTYTAKRDKIIVGFMVYQGLHAKDLKHLRLENLKLNKGKLYVSGSRRSNGRELELRPWQIMELAEYLSDIRDKLMERTQDSDHLFPYGDRFIFVHTIIKKLKKYNQKVISAKQIRASVITLWLGQYNLRKTQYLAGHRYISSTERYLQDDLENLHEIVNNFHPIN